MTSELIRLATFAAIGEPVYDRLPASDFVQRGRCRADSDCWREGNGTWICSPCLARFSDAGGSAAGADSPTAIERLTEHVRQHAAHRQPMLIAFYCQRDSRFERPTAAPVPHAQDGAAGSLATGDPVEPIERTDYEAAHLMAEHPPRWQHPNKQVVFDITCPPGSSPSGIISYSRWSAMALPATVEPASAGLLVEARDGYFDYEPVLEPRDGVDWHVNFADPHLFAAYGSALFAQDEMQVAEHPALGSVREALLDVGRRALTVESGRPTPVLVRGVERRCAVATEPNPAAGRPYGLYGNAFARADAATIARATTRLDPPTITNILAIAAPPGGYGTYTSDDIASILVTAFSGFRSVVLESHRVGGSDAAVAVHTGYWGCGAFGGNRVLMALLQVLAAGMAGLDRLVFHTGPVGGQEPLDRALAIGEEMGGTPLPTEELLRAIAAMSFEWGVSDGN